MTWTTSKWHDHDNFTCDLCPFATLDLDLIAAHVRVRHGAGGRYTQPDVQPHPLAGVRFASDEAAQAAMSLGVTPDDLAAVAPSGKDGGYTVADIRTAHRTTTEEVAP